MLFNGGGTIVRRYGFLDLARVEREEGSDGDGSSGDEEEGGEGVVLDPTLYPTSTHSSSNLSPFSWKGENRSSTDLCQVPHSHAHPYTYHGIPNASSA